MTDVAESPFRTELRHPLFDSTNPPGALDCLDAIDRAACIIDLLSYLDRSEDAEGGLSERAVAGHRWLSEMLRDTLVFSGRRLAALNRKHGEKHREKDRYLQAVLKSVTALKDADRNSVLDAMAAELQITRSELDACIEQAAD